MSTELDTKQDETKIEEKIEEKQEEVVEQPVEKEEELSPEKLRELELENARLKGQLEARAAVTAPAPQPASTEYERYLQTKNTVLGDANTLSNEDFEEKYKKSKAEIQLQFTNYEFEQERVKNAENLAILRAENQIVKKYGDKYGKYQDKIEATIKDLAPSVRQDPQRLAQYIEITLRSHLLDEKPEPTAQKPAKKEPSDMRKIIDSGFEKPNAVPDDRIPSQKQKSDEIDDEFKPLASAFGITSESERKRYKNDPQVDVAYGPDIWLTKDGVKKIKP